MKRFLIVLVACGHPSPTTSRPAATADAHASADAAVALGPDAPRTLADDVPALAERSVAMLEAVADAVAPGGDCATLATAVHAVMDEYQDARLAAAAVTDRGDGRALDHALEPLKDRVVAAAAKMQPAIDRCGKDAAFAEALTPMDTP